jgi:hypothetical protein
MRGWSKLNCLSASTRVLRSTRTLGLICLELLVYGCSFFGRPMPADEESIKVGQPELYENADLQSRLDQLTDQLKSIKPIDASSLMSFMESAR